MKPVENGTGCRFKAGDRVFFREEQYHIYTVKKVFPCERKTCHRIKDNTCSGFRFTDTEQFTWHDIYADFHLAKEE